MTDKITLDDQRAAVKATPDSANDPNDSSIMEMIDRKSVCGIGIKRMTLFGKTGYPERTPTHVYVWFQHFFELKKLLEDVAKYKPQQKWVKYVRCILERDMYNRDEYHEQPYEIDCWRCRHYLQALTEKAIWWYEISSDKYVRMTFTNFWEPEENFDCSTLYIKVTAMFEVELKIEDWEEGVYLRRYFRVNCEPFPKNANYGTKLPADMSGSKKTNDSLDACCSKGYDTKKSQKKSEIIMADHPLIVSSDTSSRLFITSVHLTKSFKHMRLFMDSTYRLLQKPVSVFGTIDTAGQLIPIGFGVTDGGDYEFVFNSIKQDNIGWKKDSLACIDNSQTTLYLSDQTNICMSSAYVQICNELQKQNINKEDHIDILDDLHSSTIWKLFWIDGN